MVNEIECVEQSGSAKMNAVQKLIMLFETMNDVSPSLLPLFS